MAWMDPLTANLLDLLFELREHPIPLTVGGGFGLDLERIRLDQTMARRKSWSAMNRPPLTKSCLLLHGWHSKSTISEQCRTLQAAWT
jgi:hypothetical protein